MSWQMSGDNHSFYSDMMSDQASNSITSQLSEETLQLNANSYEAKHRTSICSSSSGSSVCGPPSPVISTLRRQSTTSTCHPPSEPDEESGDEPWNLVAYHIPWGPGYEGYEAGTLPGPDGTCIFLRSPTPLKRQRTVQACDKCRERKAKCSGTRPTCGRCSERGFVCVYTSSNQTMGETPNSPHRKLSYSSSREQLKTSIKNRIRRKSSQTESTLLYNTAHQAFPRRHSQPASASAAPVPGSIAPIVSMLQAQLNVEEEQSDMNTLRYPYPQAAGETDTKDLSDIVTTNDYNMSREPMNLYAQSIINLNAYRFPSSRLENAHSPDGNFTPLASVNLGPIYDNGLSIQMVPPVSSETLWQIPEYYPHLESKPLTHHAFTNLDVFSQPVYVDQNYTAHQSIDVRAPEPVSEASLGGAVHFSYLRDYETNFGS